jgi:ribonuclease R
MKREQVQGITIDDQRTWDIDDAVWAEEREDGTVIVWISIADVSRAVLHGTPVDMEARARVATRYFATGNSPMLTRELAERELSLRPNEHRRTMTAEVQIAKDGSRKVRVYRSKLQSAARLNYDQIPTILADSKHPLHAQVSLLSRLSTTLLDARRMQGALVLYDLNNGWVTTEDGALKQIDRREDTIGYVLVQELMILANASVAAFAIEHDIPILFRNHEARAAAPPREDLQKQIDAAVHAPLGNLDAFRQRVHMLLGRAEYAPTVNGHYGLALPAYMHWTSPIRRYADLVSQRQFRAFLKGEPYPHTREEVEAIAAHINKVVNEEKDATSEHFKERHEAKAKNLAMDSRRIDGLNAKDFERVVKVEARSGEEIGAALDLAFRKRLADDRAPNVCLLVVLAEAPKDKPGWNALREAVLGFLRGRPQDAVSLLAMAAQTYGWAEARYEVNQSGNPHAPVFKTTARGTVDDKALTGTAQGASAKEATQRAAVLLLAAMQGVQVEEFPAPVPRAAPPKHKAATLPPLTLDKNPVSLLVERAQATRGERPSFEFVTGGLPHIPEVRCTCTMEGIAKVAVASSKQAAKTEAAKLVVLALAGQGSGATP